MAKYLVTWEGDRSRFPVDPKERAKMVAGMLEMVKQMITEGKTSDWGIFLNGTAGYSVREGEALELFNDLQKFAPYISYNIQQVLSVEEALKSVKSMMG